MSTHRLSESFAVPGVPPRRCFDYVADPDHGHEWATFAREVRAYGEPGEGRRIEARVGFLGVTFPVESIVTTWDEPHEYVLTGTSPFHGELGSRLRPDGGGTVVDAFLVVRPGRFFPVPGLVLKRALRVQFDRDVSNLRRQLRALA